MSKVYKILILTLLFNSFFLFAEEKNNSDIIRVGWYESTCFQEGMSDEEEKSGYSYEYLARISDYTGWKYQYVYGEWADLFEQLNSGKIDILAGVSITEERKKYMLFPNVAMGNDNYFLYQHKSNQVLDSNDITSFSGKKIGCIKANRMTTLLEEWIKENNIQTEVVYYDGFTQRDADFESGKLDAIMATDNNIRSNSDYYPVIKLGEEPFFVAVAKDRKDILLELNSVINSIIHLSPNYLDVLQFKCYGSTFYNSTLLAEETEWLENNPVVKVGYVTDYMPFCGVNSNGEVTGIITDIAEGFLANMKVSDEVKISYIGYESFAKMADAVRNNEVDISFPVLSDRKILNEMGISGTFDIIPVPFMIAYKGSFSEDTFNVIAVNSRPLKAITDKYPDSKILTFTKGEDCLNAVLKGDATCAIMTSYRLMYLLGKKNKYSLQTMPFSSNLDYCIGINKNSYTLLRLINKGISFIDKNSIIDASYKYIRQNSKSSIDDFIHAHSTFSILLFSILFSAIVIGLIVYISFVSKSKQMLQDNLEKVNILAALSQNYEAIHVADLDAKTFSTMRLSKGLKDYGYEVTTLPYASAVVSMVNQFVLTDLREDFLKFLEIGSLIKKMEESDSFTYRYGIVADGTGNYIYEMTFVRVGKDENRHLLVIGTKCIDNLLKVERIEGQYNEALLSESSYFYGFDVTDGRIDGNFISKKGYNPLFNLQLEFPMSYDEFNEIRAKELGIFTSKESEAALWTCEGLKNLYQKGIKSTTIHYSSEKLQMSWTATIILTEDEINHHLHAVYICKDVTEYVRTEQEQKKAMEKALEAAEQANRAKTMFLNNMSHDIRTPMNAILGFADLMEKEKNNPEKQSSYLKKLKDSGEYLLDIINNVLDMARIESGKTPVVESIMDLYKAEEFAVSAFEDLMKGKNQKFIVTKNITHRYVMVDSSKHEQITMNLLSNAIKYTPENGEIHMHMEEKPCDEPGFGTYVMTISDNGIGMNSDFVEHIFDSFSRERNTTESKIIGTGLGMSIVKRLVDLIGGTIEVESEPGIGSKFIVTFKHKFVDSQNTEAEKVDESVDDTNYLDGKRILLVEDNEFNAEIATVILEDFGLHIERACDGVEAIEKLTKSDENYYDLILMDIQMPNMDGYQATMEIRKMDNAYRKNIPIVAMTANAFEEDKKKAFAAGMNGHLAKPIKSNEVKNQLEVFLKK